MDDVLSEARLSTGRAGGQAGCGFQRIPFGIPWEFYRELIGNQQEMATGYQAEGQAPVKLGTFSSNTQKSRDQSGKLD